MGEIVEDTNLTSGNSSNSARRNDNLVEITLKAIGPARPSRIEVPSPIKVHDLKKIVVEKTQLPIENLRLILRGRVLHEAEDGDDVSVQLSNGNSLIVAVKPKAPVAFENDEDDDDLV